MTPVVSIVEGWTGALPFELRADDVAVNLTGMTVSIVLRDSDGMLIKDSTAGVTVTSATGGQITYAPATSSGDLFVATRTPYRLRFRVTDAGAKTVYFPNDEYDLIEVNPL